MAKIFLSYSSDDEERASEVLRWLTDAGHAVFFDRDPHRGMDVGEDWKQRLYRELRRTDAVICLLSNAYLGSTWCTAEVAIADARGCRILPLRLEDVTHPLLDRQQRADLDDPAARERLLATLRRIDTNGFREWRDGDNPYPGLPAFTPELTGLFFGRADETWDLAAKVRVDDGRGVVAVTGPSGCGKSSLVLAGLVPALSDWLCLEPWEPGDDPVSALAGAIVDTARNCGLDWTFEDVLGRLDRDDGLKFLARKLVHDSRGPQRRRLLVPIDQGEQLFARTTDPDSRARLARLMHAAVGPSVRAVITLRSEFLDDLLQLGGLEPGDIESFPLGPLSKDMLRLAITEPATIAGLRPEPELVARLVADTESGEALPLLAFALQRLARDRSFGDTISLSDYRDLAAESGYRELTGLHAVLASHADKALTKAAERSGLDRADVLAGLLRLVTLDDTDRRSQRRLAIDQLTDEVATAFDVFVDKRLLTQDRGEIGLAHEALLTAWPPLDELIEEQGSALRAARVVDRAAADWTAAGRADSHLWDDERLAEVARVTLDLNKGGQEFLDASRRRVDTVRRRTRNRRAGITTAMAVLSVAALIAAGVAFVQAGNVKAERDAATVRSLITQADAARESDPQLSLRLALAAQQISRGREAVASLTSTVTMNNYAGTATGHNTVVRSVAFGADGRLMAAGDGADHSVRLWDVSDRATPKPLGEPMRDHTGWVGALAFSPDGRTLATASFAEVILWDVTDPAKPAKRHTLEAQPNPGWVTRDPQTVGLAFAQDGRVLVATNGSALTFWAIEPAGARRLSTPVRHDSVFSDVVISPNGQVAATALEGEGRSGVVALWDIRDPARPVESGRLAPLPDDLSITSVAFGKDGATLAVASNAPGAVQLWNVRDPARATRIGLPLREHVNVVNDIAFSPDGLVMITASADGTVIMWDVASPDAPRRVGRPLADHRGAVNGIAFSPDGAAFATAAADRKVILWHTRDPLTPARIGEQFGNHYPGVGQVMFRPGGRLLLTTAAAGAALLWNIDDPATPNVRWSLTAGTNTIVVANRPDSFTAAFSPDGKLLAAGGADRSIVLWNVADPDHVTRYQGTLTGNTGMITAISFSADGRTLCAAGHHLDLLQWDVSDPATPRETGRTGTDRQDDRPKIGFSPDGRTLVTDSDPDGELVLRDVSDLAAVREHGDLGDDRPSGFAFAPNGRMLATTGDQVVLWNLADLAAPRQFSGVVDAGDSTQAVVFSPDGRILAVGSRGGTVSLWNVEDPDRPRRIGSPLAGHSSWPTALAFSPDSRTLVSGDQAGRAILWDLSRLQDARDHVLELACRRAGGGLTTDEWNRYVGSGQPYRTVC